ncbi:MAG: type I restriction modification DNA specificity domain protein [Mycoplasmataceae bacterium RC_NB112A]|nr:MAG: type I restriction modification DNA specificity domain protein [Mycoplasmataceae bacterium RC_NB112A]KLL01862.1 MAG: type I restriction modification DNA specificity domain protein [Mycoplasmataceae bacterium RC_NB112A]
MILFGDGRNNIEQKDSFEAPEEERFEKVITNIPFGFDDIDCGYLYKISCQYGDCLAIQHCLRACKPNGRVVVIMPESFFTRGDIKKYQETKKWVIESYSIQAIISLPRGVFEPYTGSKSSIIVTDKKNKERNYFYYYKIKNDGFTLDKYRDKRQGANDIDIYYEKK